MPTTVSSLLVVVIFLMPGFIASNVFSFVYPSSDMSETRTVLTAITFSCFHYSFWSWLFILTWKRAWYENLTFLVLFAFFVLLIFPIGGALCFTKLIDSKWGRWFRDTFGIRHPIPKAWDYFFSRQMPCWIVATLKDGRTFAGLWGSNSYASSFPAEEDLYLEKLCSLSAEGEIEGLAQYSLGGIIRMKDVMTLEVFEPLVQDGVEVESE